MAWQPEVGSGSARATTKEDFLNKLVQFCCSQHVSAVVVNAGGTGYTVGDILTYTHASAHLDARFEVTTVSIGVITGLRILASGAFAQQAVSATVSAGGTNYAVGDVLSVDGGSARLPAKFVVATLSGSAVATVTLYEGGGVYSSTPSNPAATTKVGPLAGTGSGCTLTVTYQSITGTTGLAVTGGTGSGATVDITLAQTGWSVNGRDRNDFDDGDISSDNEKQVTLVGDAAGFTNKPYVHMVTGETASGLDTRHWIQVLASTAHNPALSIPSQPGISPGWLVSGGAFMLFPENEGSDIDFWFSINDRRIHTHYNENPAAATDDGRYMWCHVGFYDRLGVESQDPYPMFVGAASIVRNTDATVGNSNVSSIAEQYWASTGSFGTRFYNSAISAWTIVHNGDSGVGNQFAAVMFPFGRMNQISASSTTDPQLITNPDTGNFFDIGIISRDRATATRILRRVPGSTPQFLLYPLVIVYQTANSPNGTTDRPIGTINGVFWFYNDDGTGSAISDFSEDYIEIGSNRYRVFHNHTWTDRYQYVAVLEDV